MTTHDANPPAGEIDPFEGWGDRTSLSDQSGRLVLVFTLSLSSRDSRPWVDDAWRPGGVPAADASEMALTTFCGHTFSTSDAELVSCLRAAGAAIVRHAHVMSHALEALPAICSPKGLRVEPLSTERLEVQADQLARTHLAAYPDGHPDHVLRDVVAAAVELRRIARGDVLGPFLSQSQVAVAGDELVGGCLLVDRDGSPPGGGPWVIDVFRDPLVGLEGIGSCLLSAALHAVAAAGLPALSLAVTHANAKARHVYTRLGFADTSTAWTLLLP